MLDIPLWEELLQPGPGKPGLASRLRQLACLPLEERIPFLDLVLARAGSSEAEIRQAALAVLAGANGRGTLELLVKSLGDEDALVRHQALDSLAAARRPAAWALATFHNDPEVRREAARRAGSEETRQWNLFLLEDEAAGSAARANLPRRISPAFLITLLEMVEAGALPPEEARSRLSAEMLERLSGQTYGEAPTQEWLAQPSPPSEPGDPLERVVALYWDAEDEPFWHHWTSWLLGKKGAAARARWAAALLRTAWRRHDVAPQPLGLAALLHPECLAWEGLGREKRRAGLRALYRFGQQAVRLTQDRWLALARVPIFWDDGVPDLWAVGALLCLAPPHRDGPLGLLQAVVPLDLLQRALERQPLLGPALFLVPGLVAPAGCLPPAVRAAVSLLRQLQEAEPLLKTMDFDDCRQVLHHLQDWGDQPDFVVSPRRLHQAAQTVGRYLARWPGRVLAQTLGDPLARLCLVEVALTLEAEAFVEAATSLDPASGQRLAAAIDHISEFPAGVHMALAQAWRSHPDPGLRRWAESWLPAPLVVLPDSRASRHLCEAEQDRLEHCLESELNDVLRPWRGEPLAGLTAPLARRGPPEEPQLAVCTALLGCHDPLTEVAQQFQAFGSAQASFLTRLDRAAQLWVSHGQLPLQGHGWLYRWDRHREAVGRTLETPEAVQAFLTMAGQLASPVLGQQLWETAAALASSWRFWEPHRLDLFGGEAVLELVVGALGGPFGPAAATILLRLHQGGRVAERLTAWRTQVVESLPDYSAATREMLAGWVRASGLVGTTRARWEPSGELDTSLDLEDLSLRAASALPGTAGPAAWRLAELGQAGAERLSLLILRGVPNSALLAETVAFWPSGEALESVRPLLHTADPEVVFSLGLALLERGEPGLMPTLIEAVCRPTTDFWFSRQHWLRWLPLAEDPLALAEALAVSPQPHAYSQAVQALLEAEAVAPLQSFLRQGRERRRDLRLQVATWLAQRGYPTGFLLLFQEALTSEKAGDPLPCCPDLGPAMRALMLAGDQVREPVFLALFKRLSSSWKEELAPALIAAASSPTVVAAILASPSERKASSLRRVAQAYAWGVARGRELTGRLFSVEMHAGEALGFTYSGSSRIFVNPLPMVRGEAEGEDIVKGLMLHEFGHHLYHYRPAGQDPWEQARQEGLGELYNLVADEHLERNLREINSDYGDKLKRLAAYAFHHSRRELEVTDLLAGLGRCACSVLLRARLGVARRPHCLSVGSREVLGALERQGASFARFIKGLRMGLGNRHGDPKVGAALEMFGKGFKDSTMEELLDITRRLAQLFGSEIQLLHGLEQSQEEWSEILARSGGMTNEELQAEIARLLRRPGKGPMPVVLNLNPEETFSSLTHVVKIHPDRALQAQYRAAVARPARRMREALQRLGLRHEPQPRRIQGRSLDRARVPRAVLHGDVRILVARQLRFATDLFLGLLVDCSSSMNVGDQMHKARLFATLLAEASRGLPGLELRVLGFTDRVLYDAGDADSCAAHALTAGGGNNDAGALAYAAELALRSRRQARLLVMISDGLPTECSVASLRALVRRLGRQHRISCAQVAVRPLQEVCFPDYVLLQDGELPRAVEQFARTVARLVRRTLR